MPQSLVKNYVHIIFSTKSRSNHIGHEIREELHNYLGSICVALESQALIIAGTQNHVHMLDNISRKVTLMNLIEKLKTHSSKWIKTKGTSFKHFSWQRGYGAFSVNPLQTQIVKDYI